MTEKLHVEVDTWLPLPPEEAFALVTQPARLRRWLIVAGSIDLRIGGEVHLLVAPGAHAQGKVTEIEPGRRFVYTHGWVGDEHLTPGSSTVEVVLEPQADGTAVTIRHRGLPAEYTEMAEGWAEFIPRLERAARNLHNHSDWEGRMETATDAATTESAFYALLSAFRRAEGQGQTATGSTSLTITKMADHVVENAQMLSTALSASNDSITEPSLEASDASMEARVAENIWPALNHLEGLSLQESIDLGAPVTAELMLRYLSVEFLVHAWDISQAIGEPLDASSTLIHQVLTNARDTRESIFFSPEAYAEALTPGPDADDLTELLALTGRRAGV